MPNRGTACFLCLAVIGFVGWFVQLEGNTEAAPETTVDLKSVPYGVLTDYVKAHKGKVIVADVWAEF